ncbi:hypothetical protein N6H18_03425 [Reichenbachiella agarivorans]|uniref:DKNYY family protein n=1 Tax=Reichenbachiella agarivorans TaxID=2979464 RepID=A0ABY6CR79_9BACT|nr:hypothetical protein [Reichenbachiella agarivorans]UXP33006.1 hypothetical protein N6H18_03425 [Reichenbachiella agarivorans]
MKRILYPVIIVLAVMMTSCFSQYRIVTERQTTNFAPNIVRLNLDMDDFEYLGKTELSVIGSSYFGIYRIDSVNNELYNFRDVKVVDLTGFANIKLKSEMKKAAYKVVDEYPDADYFVVGSDYKKVRRLFGGKRTWRYMDVHAYKFKK